MNKCRCEEFTTEFRYCDQHHVYKNGTTPLTSVTRVISSIIPYEPRNVAAAENARDRGSQTDDLFSTWLIGKLEFIPENTRVDSIALFEKLCLWWNSEKRGTPVVQGIVQDGVIAGKFDLWCDGVRYDLKCTFSISELAAIQLAAYESLDSRKSEALKVIHVTERFKTPKIVDIPIEPALEDWKIIRSAWELQRRIQNA